MSEDLDPRRKRLLFRCRHMGMRETDILLGGYAAARIAALDAAALDGLEALLEEADADLLSWILGRETPPARARGSLLDDIIAFNKVR